MATKKSSTKAKTKTAKSKTTKVSAVQAITKKQTKREVTVSRLGSLHMMSAGLFVLLALAAGFLMSNQSYQVAIGFLTHDTLTDALLPAYRVWFDVEARWLVVGLMALSTILPVLYLFRMSKNYENWLAKGRFVPSRWVDFAITGAVMASTLALISGMQDFKALKLVGVLVAVSFWLTGIVEWHYKAPHPAWKTYLVALVAAIVPFFVIAEYAVNTLVYGSTWSPWYVYALFAVLAAGFAATFRIQYIESRGKRADWKNNYLIVERNYIVVNTLMKALFAVILIFGLLQ